MVAPLPSSTTQHGAICRATRRAGPVFARGCVIRRSFGITKSLSSCLAPRKNWLRRGRGETGTDPTSSVRQNRFWTLRKGRKVYTLRLGVSLRVYFVSIQGLRRVCWVDYGSIWGSVFDTFSTLPSISVCTDYVSGLSGGVCFSPALCIKSFILLILVICHHIYNQ